MLRLPKNKPKCLVLTVVMSGRHDVHIWHLQRLEEGTLSPWDWRFRVLPVGAGIKPGSFVRAASTLKDGAIVPAPTSGSFCSIIYNNVAFFLRVCV